MKSLIQSYAWVGLVAICVAVAWIGAQTATLTVEALGHYGFMSLVPALATLLICFVSRNVILALFMGVVLGGLLTTEYNIVQSYLIPSIGSERYAQILLVYLWALGGLLGMWNKNGGAYHFAQYVSANLVHSRRTALFFTWLMGIIFHQGGTISTVLTGTTVRPVADREGVAHEELAYVVDSTASPIATVIPFNAWPLYVAGLITIPAMSAYIPDQESAVSLFLSSIPFNFYGWFAVLFTLLYALDKMPWIGGPMRAVRQRVLETGELDGPDAEPITSRELTQRNVVEGYTPALIDFFAPIGVLMGFSIISWPLTGAPMIFEAFGLALVTSVALTIARGMSVKDAFDGLVRGIKGVTIGAIILGLAVTLAEVSSAVGASNYVIEVSQAALSQAPYVLPGLLMLICMTVSFSVGSSWGTYAVVFPIALPLAFAISADPIYIGLCFGAIMGGAVFGDQCSPISDTTILASLACGSDLMDHVLTQLPLALLAAGISILIYTVSALVFVV
ncbi:MAG: sodium:proton antiporter [Gammaproteobacteria bacterium]|nr:sodium:proton antiporter [Gammaproteobacteria bacterium]